MKKIVAFLLASTMMTGMLTGCGSGSGDSSADGTLTMAVNEDSKAMWEEVITRFNEKNPDIQIEISAFPDYSALNQNVMSSHQANDDYDLIVVNHTDTLSFIKGELLAPIGDVLKEKNIDVDSIIMGNLEDMGKLGDMTYTIPVNTDTRVMMVNTDLFDKYNLEIPTTMDEMLAAGKVIADANQGDYIFTDEMCTNGDYFSTYETGIFLQSCGGQLYTVDENGKATATIDTPEMREYLNFITELLPLMPPDCTTNNEALAAFAEGNIGMYTFGPWEYSRMDFDTLGFNHKLVKVPAGPAGSVSTSGGFQLGVGSGSDNIDDAMTFIDFLLNDTDSLALVGESGLPTVESAYEKGVFASDKYTVFKEQLESSNVPQTPVANLGEVVACFTGYWNDMCAGNLTVDQVIEQAQPAVQKLLDENK